MPPKRFAASFLVVMALAAIASGCGRRGGLEPPPSAAVLSTADDGTAIKPADRTFILDPLIK